MRRVYLWTLEGRVHIPVRKNAVDELVASAVSFSPASKVTYLTFNPIAVLAQHPTDTPCLVVVV